MKMTGKELHELIEEYVADFDDADLFQAQEIEVCDNVGEQIQRQHKEGFLTLDGPDGHERFYFELD